MELNTPRNPNYAATVVRLETFVILPNCDNVKHALVFSNSIIVSKDAPQGVLGLYFPVETALSQDFLANNNLFRKPEFGNVDPTQTGFFEAHGRVKAVKFRGHKSEGFWIPVSCLDYLGVDDLEPGQTFDFIGDHEICRKYVPIGREGKPNKFQERQARLEDSIVDGQFRLHYDTENLRRDAHKIHPNDWISITEKWHGTSVVVSKVLVARKLPWYEKILSNLGVTIQMSEYGLVYSSRKVIKAVNGESKSSQHYYSEDIWGIVAKEVEDKIPNGYTLYGEIVGYTPDGAPIQGAYSYGCWNKDHKFVVYRVTSTNSAGKTIELTLPQRTEFCDDYGLLTVPLVGYGRAGSFYPFTGEDLSIWQQEFVRFLESQYVRDQDSPYDPGLPDEGIVVQVEHLRESEAYKLKNFRFLAEESKALDKEILDIETEQAEAV